MSDSDCGYHERPVRRRTGLAWAGAEERTKAAASSVFSGCEVLRFRGWRDVTLWTVMGDGQPLSAGSPPAPG